MAQVDAYGLTDVGKKRKHNEDAYASSPDWLENVPRPVRWG